MNFIEAVKLTSEKGATCVRMEVVSNHPPNELQIGIDNDGEVFVWSGNTDCVPSYDDIISNEWEVKK